MEDSEQKQNETITLSKASLWKGISGVLAVLLVIAIFTGGFGVGNDGSGPTGNVIADLGGGAPTPSVDVKGLVDNDDAVRGDPKAPVTIVEFSDYECPFCGRFYSETLGQIESKYIDTGKVKLVYKDFPLSFHPQAQKAAEAAECAGEQGKYYEMHDLLFEQGVQGGVAGFKQYARQLGLNTARFDTCLDSGEMASEVQADMIAGQRAGIQGTPGFIINGQLVSGAQPFAVFDAAIQAALNE
ncbi:MAG: thioredoxin domain-containing protein [archaeon]|nr:thioredoxin domain-containing protein [archaeon]